MRLGNLVCACVLALAAAAVSAAPPQTVHDVDLDRYVGKWYEVARLPNSFQDDCVSDVTAEYRRREDGRLDVINRCRQEDGSVSRAQALARVANEQTNAKLKVRFAPAWLSWLSSAWVDFWILHVAPDYSVTAVGTPSRKSLWILSRTPEMPEETYRAITTDLARQGYDIGRLMPTMQQGS